jgi:dihydrofolate reductase
MRAKNPIIGIMAATREGVIGINNELPWHYEEELEHFKKTTLNHIIIMGSKTYLSTPKNILLGRAPIVFSDDSNFQINNGQIVRSLEEFLNLRYEIAESEPLFMIGGAEIAHLFLEAKLISLFILTIIHKSYKGDTHLNMNYFDKWDKKIISSCKEYTITESNSLIIP